MPLEHRGLWLAGDIVLVLVHAAVLFQTLTHRVQVYIRYQDLRHPKAVESPFHQNTGGGSVPLTRRRRMGGEDVTPY